MPSKPPEDHNAGCLSSEGPEQGIKMRATAPEESHCILPQSPGRRPRRLPRQRRATARKKMQATAPGKESHCHLRRQRTLKRRHEATRTQLRHVVSSPRRRQVRAASTKSFSKGKAAYCFRQEESLPFPSAGCPPGGLESHSAGRRGMHRLLLQSRRVTAISAPRKQRCGLPHGSATASESTRRLLLQRGRVTATPTAPTAVRPTSARQ